MGGTPYGKSHLSKFAFAISLEARCFAVEHAIKHGHVTTLDIRHEFPEYDPTTARDVLYVLARYGILRKGPRIFDILGRPNQQTYLLTEEGRAELVELSDLTARLLSRLEINSPALS